MKLEILLKLKPKFKNVCGTQPCFFLKKSIKNLFYVEDIATMLFDAPFPVIIY